MYNCNAILLNEAIKGLNIQRNGIYLDGTFGLGNHSRLILSFLGEKGKLLAIDRDPEAIRKAKYIKDTRFSIIHGPFSAIVNYVSKLNLLGKINGILLDFGISSLQLDNPERGFSFMNDGPLDMRMNNCCGQSAAEWLKKASVKNIAWVLKTFGEERFAKQIAKTIVKQNQRQSITRTHELVKLITNSIPFYDKHKHCATRSFQAIRIYINDELEEIKKVLEGTLKVLAPHGRLSVISFHSLEDRLVKQFMRKYSLRPELPEGIALSEAQIDWYHKKQLKLKTLSIIQPSKTEIYDNPRARSARLRIAEKLSL